MVTKKKILIISVFAWIIASSFTFIKGYHPEGYWICAARADEIILLDFNNNTCIYNVKYDYYTASIKYKSRNVEVYNPVYINLVFRIEDEDGESSVMQGWFINISYEDYLAFYELITNYSDEYILN